MIKATLRSPAAEATAQHAIASVAQPPAPATAPRAATPAPTPARVAAPSRVPAGVITPRGGVTAPAAPKPVVQAPARAAARPAVVAPAAPIATAPATPAAPAAPAPVVTSPATIAAAPKTRAPRAPRKPAAPSAPVTPAPVQTETFTQTVETPVPGLTIDTTISATPAESPAGVDEQLFGAGQAIDVSAEVTPVEEYPTDPAEVTPQEDPAAAQPPTEAYPVPAVHPPAGFAVARTTYGDDGSGIEGDWGNEDLRFPQLKVVQGSGQLSAQFDNGSVILADNLLFQPASVQEGAVNPLLYFVPLSVKKQWRKNLTKDQQEAGELPRVVDSVDEVEALGGSTLWIGNQKPAWSPSARCLFLLERPEGSDHPNFTTTLDGREYGVGVYYAGGTAFNNSAKVIFNTGLTSLQVPVLGPDGQPQHDAQNRVVKRMMLYKNFWTIQWIKKKSGEYMVWQPQVRILSKEETGPEVRQYIENLLQSRQSFAVAAEEP